jgi:hypothetical protein
MLVAMPSHVQTFFEKIFFEKTWALLTHSGIKAGTSHIGTGTNFSDKETGRYCTLE